MFLKLTLENGHPVWINPEWIAYMDMGDLTNIHLGVNMDIGLKSIHVKETMEEVEAMIEEIYMESDED